MQCSVREDDDVWESAATPYAKVKQGKTILVKGRKYIVASAAGDPHGREWGAAVGRLYRLNPVPPSVKAPWFTS